MKLVIIDYGAGNIQSLKFAFKRLGVTAVLSADMDTIKAADKIIFPGVGEASNAMKKLKASGLDEIIPELKQPVLGICLGMQLMCSWCEEGNTRGLDIFDTEVIRFSSDEKVPHIGWNQIKNLRTPLFRGINENEYMYLVHSYYVPITEDCIATSNYGVTFSSGLNKNNFYGLQFHPEKSGEPGARILKNFLEL